MRKLADVIPSAAVVPGVFVLATGLLLSGCAAPANEPAQQPSGGSTVEQTTTPTTDEDDGDVFIAPFPGVPGMFIIS